VKADQTEVVVIGSGVGGLCVAVRLAAAGHRVTVCEQASVIGGKLGLFERDGFRFDTGPSLLTLPSIWLDTLIASGLSEA
jgi:phytoene dehydrogenase-like protein